MMRLDQISGTGCGCCGLSRRQFLAGCAACVGAAGIATVPTAVSAKGEAKARVGIVFSTSPNTGPIWPNIGFDFEPPKRDLLAKLTQLCPNVEFVAATAQNDEDAKKILAEHKDKNVDGYIIYMMACWNGVGATIASSGKPTIYADYLYGGSGEFLIQNAAARRQKLKISAVSSSRIEDLADAARCFEILKTPGGTAEAVLAACDAARKKNTKAPGALECIKDLVRPIDAAECLKRLKESTILVVGNGGWAGHAKMIQETFGPRILTIDFPELNAFYQKADLDDARQLAQNWIQKAEKVIEPSKETIEKSAAMYLGMKALMKKHNAQAITINCLGGFYGGYITAYPCLGFHELNNEGLIGACESDLISTITMLTMTTMTGRPGYISDPIIDTSKYQIIYAHCVAPNRMFGPQGPTNPYHIRNHSEDRKGAAIRSLMPLGYLTTTVEFHPLRKEVIFHQAKAVENVDCDRACRTKLAGEVKGDIEKLMNEWDQWGWHRVTFYGDLKDPVYQMADALKLRVIEEA